MVSISSVGCTQLNFQRLNYSTVTQFKYHDFVDYFIITFYLSYSGNY